MPDNPLVAPGSQLDADNYAVTQSSPSPLAEGTSWTAGSGLFANAEILQTSIANDDLVGAAFGGAAVGLDALSIAVDPIGTAAAMLAGWMIEHVKPLKAVLDSLTGSPEVIKARAATWDNVSQQLGSASGDYSGSIGSGTSQWRGAAGDSYRGQAQDTASVIGAAGKLSHGMSSLVTVVGELCASARLAIHFLVSELIGKLVAWSAEMLGTLGFATPVVIAQALAEIGRVSARVVQITTDIVEALGKAIKYAIQIKNALFEAAKILREIPDIAGMAEA